MDKLTFKALELAGFQNAEKIAQILQYVPNPKVAAEILLDIYEPISTFDFGDNWVSRYGSSDYFIWVNEVNELGNIVAYNKCTYNTQTVYFKSREDRDNKVFTLDPPKDYYATGDYRTTGYKTQAESCSIDTFKDRHLKAEPAAWSRWYLDANSYVNPLLPKPEAAFEEEPEYQLAD
jgi:hypothetical protein